MPNVKSNINLCIIICFLYYKPDFCSVCFTWYSSICHKIPCYSSLPVSLVGNFIYFLGNFHQESWKFLFHCKKEFIPSTGRKVRDVDINTEETGGLTNAVDLIVHTFHLIYFQRVMNANLSKVFLCKILQGMSPISEITQAVINYANALRFYFQTIELLWSNQTNDWLVKQHLYQALLCTKENHNSN